jgi:hypothetical protein
MADLQRGDQVAYQVWRFNRDHWEWELLDREALVAYVAEPRPDMPVRLPFGHRGWIARLSSRRGVPGALVRIDGERQRPLWLALDELPLIRLTTMHDLSVTTDGQLVDGKRFTLPRRKVITR